MFLKYFLDDFLYLFWLWSNFNFQNGQSIITINPKSCMLNRNSYTYMHNHKVLNDRPNETGINNCNCRNKGTCPLPNSLRTKCIIYQAKIDCDIAGYKQKCHLGSCETTFKDRLGNHKKSFNHVKHKNDTELSKELWEN